MVARGRAGGPPARGGVANRAGRGGAAGVRGVARQPVRGGARAKGGNLPGKFKTVLPWVPNNHSLNYLVLAVLLAVA